MGNREPNAAGAHPGPARRTALFRAACPRLRLWLAAWAVGGLCGCLYTTQHFNSGRLLEPGQTAVTLGVGRAHFFRDECPDGFDLRREGDGSLLCRWEGVDGELDRSPTGVFHDPADSVRRGTRAVETTPKLSLAYRLGVRKQWGPLTGIEIGWSLEAPTNPATLEFDAKAGLPAPAAWKVSHSLSAGWGVGAWADNTWFAEYAASRSFGRQALFGSYRFSYLATQPNDLDSSFSVFRFVTHPRMSHQVSLGWFQPLPDLPVFPDYLVPELTATAPVFAVGVRSAPPPALDFNFNLGFGWNF